MGNNQRRNNGGAGFDRKKNQEVDGDEDQDCEKFWVEEHLKKVYYLVEMDPETSSG